MNEGQENRQSDVVGLRIRDDNIKNLRQFFEDGIKTNDDLIPSYVKTYFDKHQEWSDTERILSDRKYPNGLPVKTDLEVKNLKERSKSCKALCNRLKSMQNGVNV